MRLAAAAAGLVIVGAAPRLLLAAGVLPPVLHPFVWSDLLYTWERGLSGGRVPFWDSYFEYPPLGGYLSGVFSLVASGPLVYLLLWTVVQAAAGAVVAWGIAPSGRAARWCWSLAPQLALFGPTNFDLIAVAAVVVALRWERDHGAVRSAIALAVGTATKLFPAVVLPVFLVRSPFDRRSAFVRVAVFAAVLVASYAPGAAAPYSTLESLRRYSVGGITNFDSFWGLVESVLVGLGLPAETLMSAVTLIGLAITYVVFVIGPARRARDASAPAAVAVLSVLLWSRLYSPQFSLWALPFFALAALPVRAFVLLTVADVGVFLTVYPLTLTERLAVDVRDLLLATLAAAVVLRHVALLLAWRAAVRSSTS